MHESFRRDIFSSDFKLSTAIACTSSKPATRNKISMIKLIKLSTSWNNFVKSKHFKHKKLQGTGIVN